MSASSFAQTAEPNWSGAYSPCRRHADLFSGEHADIGVKISTSNEVLARQFAAALDFWSGVLDLDWHPEESQNCAVGLLDGTEDLFESNCVAARAQLPDRAGFEGWIAYNPASKLTEQELFLMSVHEIGHLLGLAHSRNAESLMYFLQLDGSRSLDGADLEALGARHRLRPGVGEVRLSAASN